MLLVVPIETLFLLSPNVTSDENELTTSATGGYPTLKESWEYTPAKKHRVNLPRYLGREQERVDIIKM